MIEIIESGDGTPPTEAKRAFRMLQPTKAELRRRIAVLEAELAFERGLPLHRRLARWVRSWG